MKKIKGIVQKGKGIGKKLLGFPTANIIFDSAGAKINSGVFQGSVLINGKEYQTALFVSNEKNILEAHILDFKGDLYGKKLEVFIGPKLRKAMKFDSNKKLSEQIKKDVEKIRLMKK